MKEQIGGYQVDVAVQHLGPIVWTTKGADPTHGDPTAFPQELSQHQRNWLGAGLVASLLQDYITPELGVRFGAPVTGDEILRNPDGPLTDALVLIPPKGAIEFKLNEDIAEFDGPLGRSWTGEKQVGRPQYSNPDQRRPRLR